MRAINMSRLPARCHCYNLHSKRGDDDKMIQIQTHVIAFRINKIVYMNYYKPYTERAGEAEKHNKF